MRCFLVFSTEADEFGFSSAWPSDEALRAWRKRKERASHFKAESVESLDLSHVQEMPMMMNGSLDHCLYAEKHQLDLGRANDFEDLHMASRDLKSSYFVFFF